MVTIDGYVVFLVIVLASLMFASGRVRFDVIATTVLLVLLASGILTIEEAFSGFGNPVVVLLAALLIVAEMLTSTGAAYVFGQWLSGLFGGNERRLLIVLMFSAAFMGSIMSATLVVAVLLPAMLRVSTKTGIPVVRLLLPLSYAALISGMLTLIGTPPNMIVAAQLEQSGFESLGFFSFAPVGLGALALAIVYMLMLGRRLLPAGESIAVDQSVPSVRQLVVEFGLAGRARLYTVSSLSPLVGRRIKDSLLAAAPFPLMLLQRSRKQGGQTIAVPDDETLIRPRDQLFVLHQELADDEEFLRLAQMEPVTSGASDEQRWTREVGAAKLLLHPQSRFVGTTMDEVQFSQRYRLLAIGWRQQGTLLHEQQNARLRGGDSILVVGSWQSIAKLQATSRNFVVLATAKELVNHVPRHRKAPLAFAIVIAMVILLALNIFPMVITVLLAVGAGVLTGCITMDDAYKSIPWNNIVLVAGMLPVALALEKTGGVDVIVNMLVDGAGHYGPYAIMTALFCVSSVLGFFFSNAATAILMAPIALHTAQIVGVHPTAFVMTVAIAATAAFITPYSTPVVGLVVQAGGYRYWDFLKVGFPLLLLSLGVTLLVLPRIFPF